MSKSESKRDMMDFEDWLKREFANSGAFSALVVLVAITDTRVTPLCSTFFNVIGDELGWSDIIEMFQSASQSWNGAAFFAVTRPEGGPFDNPTARMRLRDLEARLADDRLVLNEGHFFDAWGRRLKIEEVTLQ